MTETTTGTPTRTTGRPTTTRGWVALLLLTAGALVLAGRVWPLVGDALALRWEALWANRKEMSWPAWPPTPSLRSPQQPSVVSDASAIARLAYSFLRHYRLPPW
jgi:hypothetical protein